MFIRPYECRHLMALMALADEFEELDTQRKRFDLEWNHRATTENSQGESRTRCAG